MKKDKIKCLFGTNESAKVVIKKGFVDELIIDCRPVLVGFYESKKEGWVSVDINTGLALFKCCSSAEICKEETKKHLMQKGYRHIRHCRKKAKQVYQNVYESEEWNGDKKN